MSMSFIGKSQILEYRGDKKDKCACIRGDFVFSVSKHKLHIFSLEFSWIQNLLTDFSQVRDMFNMFAILVLFLVQPAEGANTTISCIDDQGKAVDWCVHFTSNRSLLSRYFRYYRNLYAARLCELFSSTFIYSYNL